MQQESPQTENTPTSPGSRQASLTANEDDAPPRITRKSHRKSRAGCKNCKTRRIKCDESKPHCSNCKRRQVQCLYPNSPQNPTQASQPPPNISQDLNHLPISEIELTHYWTTTTSLSLSARPIGALTWQTLTMRIGLSNPHVLHLIFAFTALHLASCRPAQRASYTAKANNHYDTALSLLTPALANINPNNCDAVLLSVQLVCFVHWARGPQPGEYLTFSHHHTTDIDSPNAPPPFQSTRPEWLLMFRGIRTTRCALSKDSFQKTLEPAKRSPTLPLPSPSPPPPDYEAQLTALKERVEYLSEPGIRADNLHAVAVLQEMYKNRYTGVDGEYHVVFGWLYRMSDDFLKRLEDKDPLCLILFAHFAVLMWDLERFWYMRGWTWHVVGGIWEVLAEEDRGWVKWCMACVGWIEP